MRIVSLASGSRGNATAVESGGALLLIDCGISHGELCRRFAKAGLDMDRIEGVLFTHEHIDHMRGAAIFRKRHPAVPLFANLMTAEAISAAMPAGCARKDEAVPFAVFENGQPFEIGPFEVSAFPIPHDVCDPVGYMVRAEGRTYFHATDVGSPLDSIGAHLAEADCATLESNHDPVMLRMSARPEPLKRRIAGPRGHLANDEASALVARFASPRLRYLALAHLSGECNSPHIAERTMRQALAETGKSGIQLEILEQDGPGKGFSL